MDKLALFDIDGTMTKGLESHKAALGKAFKEVYGIDASIEGMFLPGMTDWQIIFNVLKSKGLKEEDITPKLSQYMIAAGNAFDELAGSHEVFVLDGVQEVLQELENNNVLLGLITGNLEHIALSKMKITGLGHYFRFGGFGSDDIDRTKVVGIAIKRAQDNYGFRLNNNVFVVGDTPRDVEAGKRAGVKTVGVATGPYSKEQLRDSGADFVLDDLKNKHKILKIIL